MNHFDWPINMLALIFIGVQLGREFGAFRIGLLVSHFRVRGKLALFSLPWEWWDWCGSFRSFVWFAWWICLRDCHKLNNLLQLVWSSLHPHPPCCCQSWIWVCFLLLTILHTLVVSFLGFCLALCCWWSRSMVGCVMMSFLYASRLLICL